MKRLIRIATIFFIGLIFSGILISGCSVEIKKPNITDIGILDNHNFRHIQIDSTYYNYLLLDSSTLNNEKYDKIGKFNDGIAPVVLKGLLGFIDSTGKYSIIPKFPVKELNDDDDLQSFKGNYCVVPDDDGFKIINKKGEQVNRKRYDEITQVSNERFVVYLDSSIGLIDHKEQVLIPTGIYYSWYLSEGDKVTFIVLNDSWDFNEFGLFDFNGIGQLSCDYAEIGSFYGKDLIMITTAQPAFLRGFINKKGRVVIPAQFTYALDFKNGYAAVANKNYKYGLIDTNGILVFPHKYDNMASYSEGLIGVSLNEKFGFVDINRNLIIPYKYDECQFFSEDVCWVGTKVNSGQGSKESEFFGNRIRWGAINHNEDTIISFKYSDAVAFSEGLALVKKVVSTRNIEELCSFSVKDDLGNYYYEVYGYVNKYGEEVIPFKFCHANSFKNGEAIVQNLRNAWVIDKTGKKLYSLF